MAYQKLQVGRGLNVIPSNTVPIPNPDTITISGQGDFTTTNVLTDTGTSFTTTVQVGDIIYNTSSGIAYFVSTVVSDTELKLTVGDVGGAADNYIIYREATNGCILFAGVAGDMSLELISDTSDGSRLIFKGIAAGAFLPIQVVRVAKTNTTATDIIALW